ncbi:MAG: serine/threonine-protein kinase [Myxococcota bacterium]
MSSGPSLQALFEQGRPAPHSLEIDQALGSLYERFGVGPRPPVTIGRYRVAGRLGTGGLGIVYRAFDPSLKRFVAIKVLKGGKEAAEHDVRLLHEAQVLARIRHAHVVEVFDVGFFEDHGRQRFFVAMELVEGTDLRRWLVQGPAFGAVVDAFVAAAQGLAAAHQAGLLHRDFKPSNVLMGEDDAVKVADFGLAAVQQELLAEIGSTTWSIPDGAVTLSWRPGGTLHYMSPEQQRGEPLTPASDQYSFCVSLYEAAYGAPLFDGEDRASILASKQQPPRLPRDDRVPRSLRHLLALGLQPRPEDRFESMEALGQALAQVRANKKRWWWIGAAGLGVTGLGVAAAALGLRGDPEVIEPSCPTPPASFDRGSSTLRRTAGPTQQPEMIEALDAYGTALRQRWDSSCTLEHRAQARVQRCLAQCGDALAALGDLFDRGARDALAKGWSLVRALPNVHRCAPGDEGWDHGFVAAATGRAKLLAAAGKLAEARVVLEGLLTDPVVMHSDRVRRHVEIELAEVDASDGRYAAAQKTLEHTYFEAASDGEFRAAARSSVFLVAHGYRTGNIQSAIQWSRTAQTQLGLVQPRDYDLETMLWHNLALTHMVAGDLGEALTTIRRAVEHASAPGVSPHLREAALQVYAELLLFNGRPAEALEIHQTHLQTGQARPQRDAMASVVNLQSLGNTLMTLHDLEGAWAAYRDAYALGREMLGSTHLQTVSACLSLAWTQGDRGEAEQARQTLEPCLAQMVQQLGEEHPNVSVARGIAARLASQRGEADEAWRLFQRALESLRRNYGESHYSVGDVLHEMGVARARAEDREGALRHLRRALRVREATLPEQHVNRAETLAALGRLELELDDTGPGRQHLAEAIEIFEARQVDPSFIQEHRDLLVAKEPSP